MAKQSHLQNAINVSRARGLTELARQATVQLQAIPVEDLGLRTSSSWIRMPRDQIERFLDGFTASTDWRDGLSFFIQTDCPLGDLARLRQEELLDDRPPRSTMRVDAWTHRFRHHLSHTCWTAAGPKGT